MSGWQPVETAPWGELLLLFEPHEMGGFMFVGTRERGRDTEWFNNLDRETQHPTHWQRLPDNPDGSRA